jgi:probable HAF family extracellular repeat protein
LTGGSESWATCINASGQVAGVAKTAANEPHAFLYADGVMKDLGALGGTASEPTDINAAGQIVGKWATSAGQVRPFLYQNGALQDLNNLVTGPLAESVTLHVATAINDSGLIAARGVDRRTQATRAYLLVPNAGPAAGTTEPAKP